MTGILIASFLGLLILGVPIAFSVAIAATIVLLVGDIPLILIVQKMFASTDSFSLVAVPFFILAGDLLARGAISKKLVAFAEAIMGQTRGALSAVSVIGGMFFAAISGSGAATTAAVGATLIPELKERKYREDSAAALIASAGCIGVVIPPSVPMVLYAVLADQSVTRLFQNGFLPGFMMGAMLSVMSLKPAHDRNYPQGAPFTLANAAKTFVTAIWGLLMPLIILGGIFSGKFTPSEAAAVAVIYAALVSFFIYRDLTLQELGLKISGNRYIVLFLVSIIILVAGIFMETSSAVILLTPVFLPLMRHLDMNLVHFGILFTVGITIGMITPPVAINLFVASSVNGLPIAKVSKAVIPYLIGLMVAFFLYVYIPVFLPWIIF
ncbi:MAG: TRAP transporter large permease [Planctomycetes bacterium]|nr:TRAP transporter large permease [Planctomycetota bacterium]